MRRKINWGAGQRRLEAMNRPPPPPAPGYLGTWAWRLPLPGEDHQAHQARRAATELAILRNSANWRAAGQPVRLLLDVDPLKRLIAGREGVIERVIDAVLVDYIYVRFPLLGRERRVQVRIVPLEAIEPAGLL